MPVPGYPVARFVPTGDYNTCQFNIQNSAKVSGPKCRSIKQQGGRMSITINYKLHGQWDEVTVFNQDHAVAILNSLKAKGAVDIGLCQSTGSNIEELREVIERMSMNETLELIEEFKRFIAKLA